MYTEKVTISSGAIWWPNLQLMQVVPSGGQICNLCKWRHLVNKFALAFYLAGELTQVLDAIPWVRCASGNVSFFFPHMSREKQWEKKEKKLNFQNFRLHVRT